MIAPAVLPSDYVKWNRRWHAPFGRKVPFGGTLAWSRPALLYRGPFTFQPNSRTREFEYPWAHAQIRSRVSQGVVVEIGGGLSGLQFVLARDGYSVINVDPGMAAKGRGWPVSPENHQYVSKLFKASPMLIPATIDRADLADQSADVILSVSTLEHLTENDLATAADQIRRVIKPGGWVILTVDLFLDLAPFTAATRNQWGTNVDMFDFLRRAGLELVEGDPRRIFGFPQFQPNEVLNNRELFLNSSGASLAQCLVTRSVNRSTRNAA